MRAHEAERSGQCGSQHEGSHHQRHHWRGFQGCLSRWRRRLGAYGSPGDVLGWPCVEYNFETGPRPQRSSPHYVLGPRDPLREGLRAHWRAAGAPSPRWAASTCAGGARRHPDCHCCHCQRQHTPHPEAHTVGRRGKGPRLESPEIQGLVPRAPKRSKYPALFATSECPAPWGSLSPAPKLYKEPDAQLARTPYLSPSSRLHDRNL